MNKPTWFYKPVEVPNLSLIQKEFQMILPKLIKSDEKYKYFHIDRSLIESEVPNYVNFLKSIGLLDRWVYSAIIATDGEEFVIHVDSLDWTERCFALNLPIQNCDDSYTIWYDAKVNVDPVPGEEKSHRKLARMCHPGTEKEICRMPANTPAWINVAIPHRPYTQHNRLRAIISARFSPELHDYFKD